MLVVVEEVALVGAVAGDDGAGGDGGLRGVRMGVVRWGEGEGRGVPVGIALRDGLQSEFLL